MARVGLAVLLALTLCGAAPDAAVEVRLESGSTLRIAEIGFNRRQPYAFYDQAMASLPHLYPKHLLLVGRRTGVLGEVRYALICFKKSPTSQRVTVQAEAVRERRAWSVDTTAPLAYGNTLAEVLEQLAGLPATARRPE
jgi:hypothetical protein